MMELVYYKFFVRMACHSQFDVRSSGFKPEKELVYVGGLLRMGDDSLLVPVWRSVGDGFTGKGEPDVWLVRADT